MSDNQSLARIEHPEPESAVVPYQPLPPPSLFGTADPAEVVARASRVAASLKEVVRKQGLISKISGKEYPRCEAWTLLGTMLGVYPVLVWSRPIAARSGDPNAEPFGWEARVEARTRDGSVVGAAEAMCLRSERNWANREDFALRSMAQTRSTAKALRMPLGFVMTLADFQATPAEEMDFDRDPAPSGTGKRPGSGKPEPGERERKPNEAPKATEKTRAWFLAEMRKLFSDATLLQWACDDGPPFRLMPNERLEDWPLHAVPTSREGLAEKIKECAEFMGVEPTPQPGESTQTPAGASRPPSESAGQDSDASHGNVARSSGGLKHSEPDQQAWFNAILTVPRKGQKRDQYLQSPDRIGDLYNARHEDEDARRRLFGFLHNWQPEGWTKRNGEKMPPSDADLKCREMLDLFGEWFEANHPEEANPD